MKQKRNIRMKAESGTLESSLIFAKIKGENMIDGKDVKNKMMNNEDGIRKSIKENIDETMDDLKDMEDEVEKEIKKAETLPKGTCPNCGGNNNPQRAYCRKCEWPL